MSFLARAISRLFKRPANPWDPIAVFHSDHYRRHNQMRQEHLASLDLDLKGLSVLEVGAGIGDHTQFFLDRGCQVVSTEARQENLDVLRRRYPRLRTLQLNLDQPTASFDEQFDIVYCYGMLYHLSNPAAALEFMSRRARRMLLLETRVSFGNNELVNPCEEDARIPSHSFMGRGCRPTRRWVFHQLKALFPFVYMPLTQPWHEEFPIDWSEPPSAEQRLTRSVFVASRQSLPHSHLVEEIPMKQQRMTLVV